MDRLIKPRFLLAIAVTAVLVGALACAGEDDPTAAPAAQAAPAAPVAPAAPAAPAAAPAAPAAPAARAAPAAAPGAAATVLAKAANAQATAVQAAATLKLADEARGARTEVAPREAPAEALAATAVGTQRLVYHPEGAGGRVTKPYREGGGSASWILWTYMSPFLLDGNNDIRQGFATAFTLSEDGKTYQFHLHPDAVFTDGTPLTAEAVKWAMEFGMKPEEAVSWGGSSIDLKLVVGAEAVMSGETENATGIVAVDDQTLEFQVKTNTPTFPYRMAVWLQGIFKVEAREEQGEDFWLNPIGVGPYTVVIDPDVDTTLTVTNNWWLDPPIIQEVVAVRLPDNSVKLLAFENKELDAIFAAPGHQAAVHDPTNPLNKLLKNFPYGGLKGYVRFNTARPPFDDINVRKAMAHAVDYGAVVEAVWGFGGVPAKSVLGSQLRCHDPSFKGYEFNPEKAKMYLSQSKYRSGENVPPVMIASRGSAGFLSFRNAMEAWAQGFKEVLNIDFSTVIVERGGEVPPGINLQRSSMGAYVPDPGFALSQMVHTATPGIMHVNDALDAKLDAAQALFLDDPGRCAAFQEVDREFMENYYILPNITLNYQWLVQPWVHGWEAAVQGMIATLPYIKIGAK